MPEPAASPATRRSRVAGVVVSASSVQAGAALGATVFPQVGPFGVAAMRQLVSAIALLAIARPPLRRIGLKRLTPALLLGGGAAALWAAYILLNQRAGALPGVTGTAVAALTGTVLTLPALVVLLARLPPGQLPHVLLIGAVTGVLSSALPYSLDLVILRTLPRSLFGLLQSVHPVAAAVFGLIVLGQRLAAPQILGIAAICSANVLALVAHRTRADPAPGSG